jgi:hypothetical protein
MCGECEVSGWRLIGFVSLFYEPIFVLLGDWITIYLKQWLDYYLWLKFADIVPYEVGRSVVNNKCSNVQGNCLGVHLHEWGRVQGARFQSGQGNVCFACKRLEWWNSSGGEKVLIYTSTIALYAILYRMLVWCLRMHQNSVVFEGFVYLLYYSICLFYCWVPLWEAKLVVGY